MNIERIARECHETNKTYCESLGDDSQLSWEDAPQWQRDSAINGVKFHLAELHEGGTPKPAASHESWMKEKIEAGWVHGETKDADAKTHPCIVPYEELPLRQKCKDFLFIAVVKAFWESNQPAYKEALDTQE